MKTTLTYRMVRYLENNKCWVPKRELIQRAKQVGFSYDQTVKAFIEMKDILNIGIIYVSPKDDRSTLPAGEYYMLHPMTPEDIEASAIAAFLFEEL